jgi:signal transduction histidine kinase
MPIEYPSRYPTSIEPNAHGIQDESVQSHCESRDLDLGHLCILIIEDNPGDRLLEQRHLEADLDCDIKLASTGKEGLAILRSQAHSIDAVLLDNGLPDMHGVEVLDELRKEGIMVPVVFVTGYGSEMVAAAALRGGANDYVVKTGDYWHVLPEVVLQVVSRERLRQRNEHLETEHIRFARLAAIGEVAAGIAHEIRNPMTVIAGMASHIQENAGQMSVDDVQQCAATITRNCSHLSGVLDEVLSGIERSQGRERLNVEQIIDEIIAFMRFDPQFRHLMEATCEVREPAYVLADRDQLKQVFINLFRNAAHSVLIAKRDHGQLTIAVDCMETEVRIRITDNGSGIAPEVFPHIFETGFTTKEDRNTVRNDSFRETAIVRGSGLGLGICRRIIAEHGGRLWAEERPIGEGATFVITLPIAEPVES